METQQQKILRKSASSTGIYRYWQALRQAWQQRHTLGDTKRQQQTLDFLPSALEILERPASPSGRWLGYSLMVLFTVGVIWACVGEVDVVATAEGKIISSSRIKDIQPLEKGVVQTVYVKEGQRVKQGDPLVALDRTLTQADQTRLSQELRFSQLTQARKQSLLNAINNPQTPLTLSDIPLTPVEHHNQQQLLQQEWQDYHTRLLTLHSQQQERQGALEATQAQVTQLQQTLPLITRRTNALQTLVQKSLAPEMELLQLEQERIEQQQTLASLQAQQKQQQAAITTGQQQILTLQAEISKQLLTDIDDYQRQQQTLTQELTKAQDLNSKQILYAPVAGTVQQLATNTIGGVVTEAQVLMKLVPQDDYLEVEAVLENKDIGFVFSGQPAEVKVNTFNFTKYGVIDAEVIDVTVDAIIDEVKGLVYKLRLKLAKNQMQIDQKQVDLLPGMTVMAEVKTGKRRLIEYVLSPLLRKMDESAGER